MRHFLLYLSFLLSSVLSAQDTSLLDRFYHGISGSCVEMTFAYSARVSGVNTGGSGHLTAQGMKWVMKGNGVEMYCDSAAVWIMDPSAKEVVIEPASAQGDMDMLANPAVIFMRLREMFALSDAVASEDGKAVIYILKPKSESDIDYFNLEILTSDASVRSGSLAMDDGSLIRIEVSDMKLTPERSPGFFRPGTGFDSSWIVTDLR